LPANSISLASYARLLRGNANFRRLWMAQVISEIGDWFYMVALYTLLLEFTGSARVLGFAFVLQVLPQALTGPLAGVVNDRLRRQRVMITTDILRAVIVTCMLLVRSPRMVWLVFPLLAAETVMWGLFEPARNAVIPNIVGKEEIIVANTLASTTWSLNLFLGSALGGVAAVLLGRDAVYVLDGFSFLTSAWLISRMKFFEPHVESRPPWRARDLLNFADVREGIRYLRSQPRLAATVFVKAGLGVTGASWVIFPIMGRSVFPVTGAGISPQRAALLGMSALLGARGLGALIGPILAAPWAQQRMPRLRLGVLLGFFLYGAGYIALGFLQHAPAAYAVVVLSHTGGAMVWVFSTTMLQLMSDDRFRGRVFAADLSLCTVMLAATAYAAGAAIDRGIDVRVVAMATGTLTIFSGLLWLMMGIMRKPDIQASATEY
jgi:MFS family permease